MTKTRPPQKQPWESWDSYYEKLWQFFDLDNDSGEYKEGMTELEAQVRVWKLKKEGRMPSPARLSAATAHALRARRNGSDPIGVPDSPAQVWRSSPQPSLEEIQHRMDLLAKEYAGSIPGEDLDQLYLLGAPGRAPQLLAWATRVADTHIGWDSLVEAYPSDDPLRDLASRIRLRVEERLSELPVVSLPTPDPELEIWVAADWDDRPDHDCPKKVPKRAQQFMVTWLDQSPFGGERFEFFISQNRSRSHWVLWEKACDEMARQMEWDYGSDQAVKATCRRSGLSAREAAIELLRAAWKDHVSNCDWEWDWDYMSAPATGPVGSKELRALFNEIWPNA